MIKKSIIFLTELIVLCTGWNVLSGQDGEAGRESPFSIGIGARALALGSAAVAFPDDPYAFSWNPAGMVVVDQKEVGLSLTTLFEGTQYNFVGYIHPTMSIGAFGFGIARIGTNGIVQRSWDRGIVIEEGEIGYWWGKFIISYAMTPLKGLSAGINFNVNRQVLGQYSTNGFGVDIGFHYGFQKEQGILKKLYLGLNIENFISPRLKLGVSSEKVPYNLRLGIAKVFFLRENTDRLLLLADLDKGQNKRSRYHIGTEYAINKLIFIRTGLNKGKISLGGGIRYQNFQLDYGTYQIGDSEFFPLSHRFSLTFYIGTRVSEKKELLEAKRQHEIQQTIRERMEAAREKRIEEGLKTGREYLEKEDYFNARLEFSRVLMENKENAEAQELIEITTEKEQELQKMREEELLKQGRESEKQQRDNVYIQQRFNEGLEAFTNGNIRKAIEKWEEAVERDPENPQINEYIKKAKVELEHNVNTLISKAKKLIQQENLSKAYQVLDQAKNQAEGNPELQNKVIKEVHKLDKSVDFLTNYQAGLQKYGIKEYEAAARFFKKALEYEPNHDRARRLYRNSLAKSLNKKQEMKGEVREKFYIGLRLYSEGRYEEALKVWEEALKLDPQNVKLLEAIEGVQSKIEAYEKK